MFTMDTPVTDIASEVKRFGIEIRRRRQSLDLSLAELAERVGLTSNFIGTIENGTRNPSISTLVSLAKGLGASPAELVAEAHGLGPPGLEVARLFNSLAPVVQDRFIELLRLICIRNDAVPRAPTAPEPEADAPPRAAAPPAAAAALAMAEVMVGRSDETDKTDETDETDELDKVNESDKANESN